MHAGAVLLKEGGQPVALVPALRLHRRRSGSQDGPACWCRSRTPATSRGCSSSARSTGAAPTGTSTASSSATGGRRRGTTCPPRCGGRRCSGTFEGGRMNIRFKITSALLATVRIDLRRPHPFAHERVGFIAAGLAGAHDELADSRAGNTGRCATTSICCDPSVGAMMSDQAIRRARQWAMDDRVRSSMCTPTAAAASRLQRRRYPRERQVRPELRVGRAARRARRDRAERHGRLRAGVARPQVTATLHRQASAKSACPFALGGPHEPPRPPELSRPRQRRHSRCRHHRHRRPRRRGLACRAAGRPYGHRRLRQRRSGYH